MRPGAFLDRDGTLIEEVGYLDRLDRLAFFPFAIDAVRLLQRGGYAVVIVTNQAGVGRGMYQEAFVHETHELIAGRLAQAGVAVDGFYYCPHHPEATVEKYRMACECRKPGPGMLRQASAEHGIDLARSFAVGDKWSDVQAGIAAGGRGVLVRTGYGRRSESSPPPGTEGVIVTDNVMSAAAWILREA
jgi:D-glycero-D-manno-heptose 1,7-bisphosphate phosphatase